MKIQESFLPSFFFISSPLGQTTVSGNHPSSVILGVFVFFFIFILIFCESLALYAKSRGLMYTMLKSYSSVDSGFSVV